jgi:molecular chaperone HtpG
MSAHMERLMKAMNREFTPVKRTLELNGAHPAVLHMNTLYERNATDPRLDDWAQLLYEQALVAEGQPLPDVAAYGKRVSALLSAVTAVAVEGA